MTTGTERPPPEARANRRLLEELRDEIATNAGLRDEYQDWARTQELIEALLELTQ